VYGVLGVLIGSRLGHVLFYDLDHALEDPLWVFKIWTGGLASHGAVVGLIAAMFLFTRQRGVPFLEGADRFVFSAALGATLVRLGNFFNSEIVGRETHADWGVRFIHFDGPNAPLRHPSQLYEVGLGLLVMLCLYVADTATGKEKRPRGLLISVFFVVYFAGRFTVEYFKEYQKLPTDSPLTMGQYLSIPGFLLGVYGVQWALRRRQPAGWPEEDEEDDDLDDDDDDDLDDDDAKPATSRHRGGKKKRKLYDADVADEFDDDDDQDDDGKKAADDGDSDSDTDEPVAAKSKKPAPPKSTAKKKASKKPSSEDKTPSASKKKTKKKVKKKRSAG
jgi:prolipoprotein diacylglyceryl transferase